MKYDQKWMNEIANDLENYLDIIDSYVIIEGITKDEYENAKNTVKKLIKKLRKGKGDDVFDKERYLELQSEGKIWYENIIIYIIPKRF